jgi:hypothetical protein
MQAEICLVKPCQAALNRMILQGQRCGKNCDYHSANAIPTHLTPCAHVAHVPFLAFHTFLTAVTSSSKYSCCYEHRTSLDMAGPCIKTLITNVVITNKPSTWWAQLAAHHTAVPHRIMHTPTQWLMQHTHTHTHTHTDTTKQCRRDIQPQDLPPRYVK